MNIASVYYTCTHPCKFTHNVLYCMFPADMISLTNTLCWYQIQVVDVLRKAVCTSLLTSMEMQLCVINIKQLIDTVSVNIDTAIYKMFSVIWLVASIKAICVQAKQFQTKVNNLRFDIITSHFQYIS